MSQSVVVKQTFDPAAALNAQGDIEIDKGATTVALVRWEAGDPDDGAFPQVQTLERLACCSLVAVFPDRGVAVKNWLAARPGPPPSDPKEHAWSYMAGWYAEHGCEYFYTHLWKDPHVVRELEARLRASGAWQVALAMAK